MEVGKDESFYAGDNNPPPKLSRSHKGRANFLQIWTGMAGQAPAKNTNRILTPLIPNMKTLILCMSALTQDTLCWSLVTIKRGAFIRKLRDYLGIFVWLATCGAEWIFAELTKPDWQDRFVSILLKINQILITH